MFYQQPKQKTNSSNSILRSLILILSLGGNFSIANNLVFAETILQCQVGSNRSITIANTGGASYSNAQNGTRINASSNPINYEYEVFTRISTSATAITDSEGAAIYNLSLLVDGVENELIQLGLTAEEAATGSIAAIAQLVNSLDTNSTKSVLDGIRANLKIALPEKQESIDLLSDISLFLALSGTSTFTLENLGLTNEEATTANTAAVNVFITNNIETVAFRDLVNSETTDTNQTVQPSVQVAVTNTVPDREEFLDTVYESIKNELINLRNGVPNPIQTGSKINFNYTVANEGFSQVEFTIPNLNSLRETGITGSGQIEKVFYQVGNNPQQEVNETDVKVQVPGQQQLKITLAVVVEEIQPTQSSTIAISLDTDGCEDQTGIITSRLAIIPPLNNALIDPLGQITGCDGQILDDYTGFSVGIYDADPNPNNPGGFTGLTDLTTTEFPDILGNGIPAGLGPNTTNINPYPVDDLGRYNFLFDRSKGQTDPGREYILLVDVPPQSIYQERRIKLTIGQPEPNNPNLLRYTATAVDGRPIATSEGEVPSVTGDLQIQDAATVGLALAAFDLNADVCEAQEIAITKTGDRASATPGDIVLYRLTITNGTVGDINSLKIVDLLPHGFNFKPRSVRGKVGDREVTINVTTNGRQIILDIAEPIPSNGILNIVYGAELTPDALRGTGINSASVSANRAATNRRISAGPANYKLRVRGGIISDSGIIVGRVFVDKNFDGEQQKGEPGVPNAVVFLEDGNRITTDENGVFSVKNVLPGYHTGTLDLTSIPGYNLAPNLRFKERNSKSRLVRLAPSGMVRMNFAVSPTSTTEEEANNNEE
ncbi:MAG: hypothetical protein QNJ38_23340 [Prochloraceae cyanobacterium]|nr:hypothetical protein [Prochloraceae cyanobacterium]